MPFKPRDLVALMLGPGARGWHCEGLSAGGRGPQISLIRHARMKGNGSLHTFDRRDLMKCENDVRMSAHGEVPLGDQTIHHLVLLVHGVESLRRGSTGPHVATNVATKNN